MRKPLKVRKRRCFLKKTSETGKLSTFFWKKESGAKKTNFSA
jgi:hypothetical protein